MLLKLRKMSHGCHLARCACASGVTVEAGQGFVFLGAFVMYYGGLCSSAMRQKRRKTRRKKTTRLQLVEDSEAGDHDEELEHRMYVPTTETGSARAREAVNISHAPSPKSASVHDSSAASGGKARRTKSASARDRGAAARLFGPARARAGARGGEAEAGNRSVGEAGDSESSENEGENVFSTIAKRKAKELNQPEDLGYC